MANVIFESITELKEGLQVEVKSGKHGFILDEPAELGGKDTGMNPVEALLGSLGACMCIVGRSFAKMHRIDLEDLKVHLEGDLDPDGFMGKNKEAKIGFSEIRMKLHIKSSSSKEDIDKFVDFMKATCPVCDTLINTPRIKTEVEMI